MLNLYPTAHQPDLFVKICAGIEVFMCYIVQKNNTLSKCKITRSTFTFAALILIVMSPRFT